MRVTRTLNSEKTWMTFALGAVGILVSILYYYILTVYEPNICGQPPLVRNIEGRPIISGNKVFYMCAEGFNLVGLSHSSCQSDGKWSTKPSCCKGVLECPAPPLVKHATQQVRGRQCGQTVTYLCDAGYVSSGSNPIVCEHDSNGTSARWTSRPFCLKDIGFSFSHSGFIAFKIGNSNMILGSPHGGYLLSDDLRERPTGTKGCWVNGACQYENCQKTHKNCTVLTEKDSYTMEMTVKIAEVLNAKYSIDASVLLNLLHRRHMDANRAPNQFAWIDERGKQVWMEYQSFINSRKDGRETGLYLDIHGHARSDYLTLQFGLPKKILATRVGRLRSVSSIHNLFTMYNRKNGGDIDDLLCGSKSLGFYLQNVSNKLKIIPSPRIPSTEKRIYPFSGGYNTVTWGVKDDKLNVIQLEFPSLVRNKDVCIDEGYCEKVADAIAGFYLEHFDN